MELFRGGFQPKGPRSQRTRSSLESTMETSPELENLMQSQLKLFGKVNDKMLYLKVTAADGMVPNLCLGVTVFRCVCV